MALPTPRPWPVPMWPEFWPWAGCKLAGIPLTKEAKKLAARYHRETGKYGVPPWAWVRLSYMKARPRFPVSQAPKIPYPFNGKGMFLLEPRGGTEDLAAWKAAGGTYVLLNLGYVGGGHWEKHRARAKQLGLALVPWKRIYTASDVSHVEITASEWGSVACAHNLEAEATTTMTPEDLAFITDIYDERTARAVITEPWLQNGAGWHHLSDWVAMPECFLNANAAWDPTVLCAHAKAEGMPLAVPVFGWGNWSDAATYVPPSQYLSRWNSGFAVYPGDGKEHLYPEWRR